MAILRSSPRSPFGRKVMIAAAILGLGDTIELVPTDTTNPADPVRADNPLGKIPVLIPSVGAPVYDSRVIVEYLDLQAGGGKIIPAEPAARIAALTLQALGDGIADAAVAMGYETRHHAEGARSDAVLENQRGKIARALAYLEAHTPAASASPKIGEIAVVAALGYLDLRLDGAWRAGHPRIVAFLDAFAAHVPAFEATKAAA
jgi:glutathione S-transferase